MKTIEVKLSGLKGHRFTFVGLVEATSKGLGVPVVKMVIASEDNAYATMDISSGPLMAKSGAYQWTAPDGQMINVSYQADENGFLY